MQYSSSDYNILSYLLFKNEITYDQVMSWAYNQFSDEGIDLFIEKIVFASDVREIIRLISNEYQVYGEPSAEFLVGEIAEKIEHSDLTLHKALCKLLYDNNIELSKEEQTKLYIAEDFYDWHETPDKEAIKIILPLFNLYRPIYKNAVSKFKSSLVARF